MKLSRVVFIGLLTGSFGAFWVTPASAACHFFTVKADPASAAEGAQVKVTVSRDAGVNPSSVRVSTIAETATGGEDYTELNQRIEFGGPNDISRDLSITVKEDTTPEGAETFRVKVSEAAGCPANTRYTYSDDARVTIPENDQPAPAPVSPKASPSPSPSPSPTKSPSPSPSPSPEEESPSPTEEASPTPEVVTTQAADEGDDGGLSTGVIVALAAAIVAVGAGGGLLYLRRRGAQPPPVDGG